VPIEVARKRFRLLESKLNRALHGRRWARKAKRGQGVGWVRVVEYQQRDVIHFHALFTGIAGLRLRDGAAVWREVAGHATIGRIRNRTGTLSSSDAQRFGMRASSLLASYYPRYYGYYEKAIGVYTHISDQYAVYSTKVISCSPREALYVLDGLLENNTILQIREHTTDTHGFTENIFALCHLLGFYFMPRIRDLKDQQLYRVDRFGDYGVFTPLLTKTADLTIVEEQWEEMIRVALSLKQRTAPAHVVVQRLTNSFPSDRLSKAFTNLGRIIKTQYIMRYLTDVELRQTVQLQLNKGEYRHKLPRRIFFADQGEFTTGDYEEIMNKASCLSLVSNAILYWNTIKINEIVESLRSQGENIDKETLSHISLLPFRHVVPNGTYFIEDV
jgi:TnpA family transposase